MEGQVIGGWLIFAVGVLVVVLSVVAAAIKALVAAAQAGGSTTLANTPVPGGMQVLIALMKSVNGFAFVMGLLAIHLGLVMISGGKFLGLPFFEFADPTPV